MRVCHSPRSPASRRARLLLSITCFLCPFHASAYLAITSFVLWLCWRTPLTWSCPGPRWTGGWRALSATGHLQPGPRVLRKLGRQHLAICACSHTKSSPSTITSMYFTRLHITNLLYDTSLQLTGWQFLLVQTFSWLRYGMFSHPV